MFRVFRARNAERLDVTNIFLVLAVAVLALALLWLVDRMFTVRERAFRAKRSQDLAAPSLRRYFDLTPEQVAEDPALARTGVHRRMREMAAQVGQRAVRQEDLAAQGRREVHLDRLVQLEKDQWEQAFAAAEVFLPGLREDIPHWSQMEPYASHAARQAP